jgi:hypothetical protein
LLEACVGRLPVRGGELDVHLVPPVQDHGYVSRRLGKRGRLKLAAGLVFAVGVLSSRDQHEAGLKLLSGRDHDVLQRDSHASSSEPFGTGS